jgi:hypothetical protein
MAYRRKTLRRMSPTARKVARLAGEASSLATRLKNLIPELQQLDADSEALKTARSFDNLLDEALKAKQAKQATINPDDDLFGTEVR